jgi:hypothetical protein
MAEVAEEPGRQPGEDRLTLTKHSSQTFALSTLFLFSRRVANGEEEG